VIYIFKYVFKYVLKYVYFLNGVQGLINGAQVALSVLRRLVNVVQDASLDGWRVQVAEGRGV